MSNLPRYIYKIYNPDGELILNRGTLKAAIEILGTTQTVIHDYSRRGQTYKGYKILRNKTSSPKPKEQKFFYCQLCGTKHTHKPVYKLDPTRGKLKLCLKCKGGDTK